jgi:hypothetical protein
MSKAGWIAAAGTLWLLSSAAFGQIHWIHDLEEGLTEARERNAPIVALFWDYN